MKFITKSKEPIEFSEWKANDKMFQRNKPNWDRLKSPLKDIIRNSLKKEQGGICCYCESELIDKKYHTEHLKPQSNYPELQLDYDNLLCSCQLELEKGEPRHCGNNKGSWFDETLLITPLNPDCETKFKYTFDGYISESNENEIAAKVTIEKLNLNIDKLNDMRKKAIEPFLDENINEDELELFVNDYLKQKNGKFSPFFTTIKYLFQ